VNQHWIFDSVRRWQRQAEEAYPVEVSRERLPVVPPPTRAAVLAGVKRALAELIPTGAWAGLG